MANNLLTTSKITREAVALFVNFNAFIKNIERQFDDEFGRAGNKIGSQLRIRLPNDYTVADGPVISVQDTAEQQTVLSLATQRHVDVSFTTADLLLSLDEFSERILSPMMNNLAGNVAAKIMSDNAETICNINGNMSGSNAVLTPTAGTFLDAQATLAMNSAPAGAQKIINSPRTEARAVQSLSGLLNPASAISDQYYDGMMYRALGATWFQDQTVIAHTAGTFTVGTVSGANQTGTTLTLNAITGTLLAGDIFTIANVFAVNRVTKVTTGELRQFVVTASVATAATSLTFYPAITPAVGGAAVQYQTVDASPANGAALSLYTNPSVTYRKNFRFIPQMITMVTGDLPLPQNKVTARHKYSNVSMRFVKDYMIGTDQEVSRLDVLFGSLTVRPEWGVVVPDIV